MSRVMDFLAAIVVGVVVAKSLAVVVVVPIVVGFFVK